MCGKNKVLTKTNREITKGEIRNKERELNRGAYNNNEVKLCHASEGIKTGR